MIKGAKLKTIETTRVLLNSDEAEIIKTILYFDIFKYPLTREELFENSAVYIDQPAFDKVLDRVLNSGYLKQLGNYILSINGTQEDILKREAGNRGAAEIMPVAIKYARKVASFPFVSGVYLSGSISKNYFDEKSDIDFFIVTKPGRLWICRTFVILKYKLLSPSRRKFWCPNYFITADDLGIPDINAFTGTELAFLIPVINYPLYKKVLEKNSWYKLRYPNKKMLPDNCVDAPRFGLRIFEFLFAGSVGNAIDNFLLKTTLRHWRKKYPLLSDENFELQFRSRKNVCKRHSHGFQNKVLIRWQEKTKQFEEQTNVLLSAI